MDTDQENRDISKGSRGNRRKSSILKDSPGRPPLVKVEVNAPPRRSLKRVSFADTHTIKEFLATVGASTEWNSSYETPAQMVESSQSVDITNQSFRLDPEKNDMMLEDADEFQKFLCGKPNQTLVVNDSMAVPIAHSTMLPSPCVGLELDRQQELQDVVPPPSEEQNEEISGSPDFLSDFLGLKKNKGADPNENCSSSVASSGNSYLKTSVLQPSKAKDITSNKTMDMEITHAGVGVFYKESVVGMAGVHDAASPLTNILSSLPDLNRTKEKKVVSAEVPVVHSEQNKLEIDKTYISLAEMEVTEAVLASQTTSRMELPEQVIAVDKTGMSSVNLELTEALLAPNLVSFSDLGDGREVITENYKTSMSQGNMEMTETVNTLWSQETTDRLNVSKHGTPVKDKTGMSSTNMEMTEAVNSFLQSKETTDKEMTEAVNSFLQSKETTDGLNVSEHGSSVTDMKRVSMANVEITEALNSVLQTKETTDRVDVSKHNMSVLGKTKMSMANMEITEGVNPLLQSQETTNRLDISKYGTSVMDKTRMSVANIEITEGVNPLLQSQETTNRLDISKHGTSVTDNTRMSMANMEITEAVNPLLQSKETTNRLDISKHSTSVTDKTGMSMANMEITEAVNPLLQSKETTNRLDISKHGTSVTDKTGMSMANMEITEGVNPFLQSKETINRLDISKHGTSVMDNTRMSMANMEITEGVNPLLQSKESTDRLNISKHGTSVMDNTRMSMANMEITEGVNPLLQSKDTTNRLDISKHGMLVMNSTKMSMANMEITEGVNPLLQSKETTNRLDISKHGMSLMDKPRMSMANMEITEIVNPLLQSKETTNRLDISKHGTSVTYKTRMNMANKEITEGVNPFLQSKETTNRLDVSKHGTSVTDTTGMSMANIEITEVVTPLLQSKETTNTLDISMHGMSVKDKTRSMANMEITEAILPSISVRDQDEMEFTRQGITIDRRTSLANMEMTKPISSQLISTGGRNALDIVSHGISEKCSQKLNIGSIKVTESVIPDNMEVTESVIPSQSIEAPYGMEVENQLISRKDKRVSLANMEVTEAIIPSISTKNLEKRESAKQDLFEKGNDKVNTTHMEVTEAIFPSQLHHVEMAGMNISRQVIPNPSMSEAKMQMAEVSFSSQHMLGKPQQAENLNHILEKSKIRVSSEGMAMTESVPLFPPVPSKKEESEGISRSNISASNCSHTKSSLQPIIRLPETQNERVASKYTVLQVECDGMSHHAVSQLSSDLFADRVVQENSMPQGNVSFLKERNNTDKSSQQSEHASDFNIRADSSSDVSLTKVIKDGGGVHRIEKGNQEMLATTPDMNSISRESNLVCNNVFDENEGKSKMVKDISLAHQASEESLSYDKRDLMQGKEIGSVQKEFGVEKKGKRLSDEFDEEDIQPSPKKICTAEGSVVSFRNPSSPQSLMVEGILSTSAVHLAPGTVNASVNKEIKVELSLRKEVDMHENTNGSHMEGESMEEVLDDINVDLMDSSNSTNNSPSGSFQKQEKWSRSSRRKSVFEEYAYENPLYSSLLLKLNMVPDDICEDNIGVEEVKEEENCQKSSQKCVKNIETSDEAVVNEISAGSEECMKRIPSPVNKSCCLFTGLSLEEHAFAESDNVSLPSEEFISEDSSPMEKSNDLENCIENQEVISEEKNIEDVKDFGLKENLAEPEENSQTVEGCLETSGRHLQSTSIIQEDSRLMDRYKSVSLLNGGVNDASSDLHSFDKNQGESESAEARESAVEESNYNHGKENVNSGLSETSKNIQPLQTSCLEKICGAFNKEKTQNQSENLDSRNHCLSEMKNYSGIVCTDVTSHNDVTKPRAFEDVSFSLSSKEDMETLSKNSGESRMERKSFVEDFVASLSSSQISFVSMSESFNKNKEISRNKTLTSVDNAEVLGSTQTQRKDVLESQNEVIEVKETHKKIKEMEAESCCTGCRIAEGSCIDNICGIRKWEVRERTATSIKLGIKNSPLFVCLSLNKYDTHYIISSASWGPQACDLKTPLAQLVINLFGCRASSCFIAMNSEPLCEVHKFLPSLAKTFKDISDLFLELFQVSAKYITKYEQNSLKVTLSSVEAHVSVDICLLLRQPFEDPWQPYTVEPKVTVTVGNIRHSTFYAAITGVTEGPLKILRMADAAYSIIKNMV